MSDCPVHRYRLTMTVQAPFLTAATATGPYGLDAVAARRHDGRWMVAGTHVVGKLFQALEELSDAAAGCFDDDGTTRALFRVRAGEDAQDPGDLSRARIHIGDLTTADAGDPAGERTRIAIDNVTGAAQKGALQAMQEPFRPGETVTFSGILTILGGKAAAADAHAGRLRKALQWIPQIGGGRTIGMGRVLGASLLPLEEGGPGLVRGWHDGSRGGGAATRFRLVLSFEDGFCCASPQRHRNVFTSESHVSGAVIKGALAGQMLAAAGLPGAGDASAAGSAYPRLAAYLDRIRIAHAFPAAVTASGVLRAGNNGQLQSGIALPGRPRVPPLSLATFGSRLFDLALADESDYPERRAPAFRQDWKGRTQAQAEALTGWSEPRREMRVRTRISREGRAAAVNQLFAIETVIPEGHVWLGEIDLEGCADERTRDDAREELEALLQRGLYGIGKTNAFAHVHLIPLPAQQPLRCQLDETIVVTLQTPALLLGPDTTETLPAYSEAFRELAGAAAAADFDADPGGERRDAARCRGQDALKLTAVFADEDLTGGMYLALRAFRGRGIPYQPLLLTQAGSVFVFTVCDPVASEVVLAQWARHGLGTPSKVPVFGQAEADDGRRRAEAAARPFDRRNGFGEIVVNDPLHWAMRPHVHAVLDDDT